MHTAKLIRNEMFREKESYFNGFFDTISQQNSVTSTLVSLIGMLLEGPGTFEVSDNQAALSISQLIVFNAIKGPRRMMASGACQKSSSVRASSKTKKPLLQFM